MAHDPFEDPTPRVSRHASADSFRNRVIMIEPTNVERNVPKSRNSTTLGDKITANVTVLDGKGPVQVYSQRVPQDIYLDGPLHRGVWFNQNQICEGLQTLDGDLRKRVLCKIDTLKPGTMQGEGNPWVMNACTPEEKAAAAEILNQMTASQFDAPTPAPAQGSPFQKGAQAPF